MAIKSSFFNSVGGDRKYKAEDWAAYFGKFISNGFFADYLSALQVVSGTGMNVTVNSGAAFVNGYMMENTADYNLQIGVADGVLSRIDRIVVRWSLTDRNITLAVKPGTPAISPTAPALQRDEEVYELGLATVKIPAGSLSVASANVTDTRLDTSVCGAVTGVIDQIDTTEFAHQYNAMLDQLEEALQNVQDGSAWVMKTGDTMTGNLIVNRTVSSSTSTVGLCAQRTTEGSVERTDAIFVATDDTASMFYRQYDGDGNKIKSNSINVAGDGVTTLIATPVSGNESYNYLVTTKAVVEYAQKKVTASTTDLTAGESALADGEVWLVYE